MLFAVLSIGVTALACNHPWQNAKLKVERVLLGLMDDKATASMDRCTCNPIDNYLSVQIHVQYTSGNTHYWYPSQTSMVYTIGYDIDSISKDISKPNMNYAEAKYISRCRTGEEVVFIVDRHITQWNDNGVLRPGEGYGTSTYEEY